MPGSGARLSTHLEQVPRRCSEWKRKPTDGNCSVTDAKSRRGSLRCCGYFISLLGPPRHDGCFKRLEPFPSRMKSNYAACPVATTSYLPIAPESMTVLLLALPSLDVPSPDPVKCFFVQYPLEIVPRTISEILVVIKEDCIEQAFIRLLHRHRRHDYFGVRSRDANCICVSQYGRGRWRVKRACAEGEDNRARHRRA